MSEDILKMIYYLYVHSIKTYGMIFFGGGGVDSPHSTDIYEIQKRIIQIMIKSSSSYSCRQLFKRLEILPLQSQIYIFCIIICGKEWSYIKPIKKSIPLHKIYKFKSSSV